MVAFRHCARQSAVFCCCVVACLGLIGASSAAKADLVFTLNNVVFSDGATASGTFTIDQYGDFLNNGFDITTTSSPNFAGGTYTPAINAYIYPNDNPPDTFTIFVRDTPHPYQGFLQLTFTESLTGPLSDPGHDPLVLDGASFECSGFGSGPLGNVCPQGDSRNIVSGGVIDPVPEPASLALLGGGLLGLLALRRRRAGRS